MSNKYIQDFYKEVCKSLDGDYKIILEPGRDLIEEWIEYDTVEWKIESAIQETVNNLCIDKVHSIEEKIIKLYEYICLNYIYDANVLYFFKKDLSDPSNIKYISVDWYGRVVGPEWIEKRQTHNRRICYEFSRFYAKAINTLINNTEDIEAFMLGDKDNTHYVVGLTGKDYSIILDQDDFNSIKDLTRLKMGLTIKGIHILRDETGKFKNVVDAFNNERKEYLPELKVAKEQFLKDNDTIKYVNTAIKIFNKYNIDSQGFFECVRHLIESCDIKIEKIWKKDTKNAETRYERCLYFIFKNKTYLLDSINKTLKVVNIDNLDKNLFVFNNESNGYKYYGG